LLVTPETGILIAPVNEQHVVTELAKAMDRLAEDGDLAERMSNLGRRIATDHGFMWSRLVQRWAELYRELSATKAVERETVLPRKLQSHPTVSQTLLS
jgi:glycosyltransferase involved in cell wall biosynthesis